jgi:hypothetical protein
MPSHAHRYLVNLEGGETVTLPEATAVLDSEQEQSVSDSATSTGLSVGPVTVEKAKEMAPSGATITLEPTSDFAFGNILFAGECNQLCPHCIGQCVDAHLSPSNLDRWPLPGASCEGWVGVCPSYTRRITQGWIPLSLAW